MKVNPFQKTVASIMGDFGKKIEQLKVVQRNQNRTVTKNNDAIKALRTENVERQREVGAAQKAINALEQFVV